ncbi:DASS family sodium-coupled anion symporter [Neptuniibacter sp.]|uniref:DASS family sodium-coupled anion symporter n=1 Tax=Neptuniibacter sp. TaxID=1962643 RepID=UPI00260C1E89|nr:DASS family sodium-coupled anion symporter [Neptuniibacter sp.]MCP4597720.1 DASS family sodium-coupled anion symporter [Neptuniibacter sp.]
MVNTSSLIRFISILILSALLLFTLPALSISDQETAKGLAMLFFIGALWISETLPITVTALLVPLAATLLGIFNIQQALTNFAHPIIFLFLGGFALAAALHKHGIDRALANHVLRLANGRLLYASMILFLLTAFISMWISNTATTAMMLPLALGMLSRFEIKDNPGLYLFILLGIAYSANIGGIGTLVGSPPNAIAAAEIGLGFADWMKIGMPIVIILLPCMIALLFVLLAPKIDQHFEQEEQNFTLTLERNAVLAVFLLTIVLWLFSKPLSSALSIEKGFDSMVAILAIFLLGILKLVGWKDIEKTTDWGVLLLFGGGITLSAILKSTGASSFLAEQISLLLSDTPFFLFLALICTFVVFLTEMASNTASTALMVPIFISIAAELGFPGDTLAIAIAVSASCAFMLPVATPPNAIVFGTGYIPQKSMMRTGFFLNLLCIVLISVSMHLLLG